MTVLRCCRSVRGVTIRLTDAQSEQIVTARPYLKDLQDAIVLAVEDSEEVYAPPPTIQADSSLVTKTF